ncbi:MAG TPA: serine hydrolase domain-containing protein [Streptosporangiaceae bacterium]|jgi:CubicO group peptidase (beta-lactamase class C family)
MTSLIAHITDIQARLDALASRHNVPGAALAVSQGSELMDFATGVLNARTSLAATTDSVFQIGSNTKLMTTALVMQLVEAGQADLDAPVRRYVPAFQLAEPGAADLITLRHLLTHTSGIQGDYFQGFGRGDGAVARYVESLRDIDLVHQPGQLWSYCNSGFVLAGHVVEKLTGMPYHQALRERILAPLGMRHTTVLPEEMLARRCAVGHVPGPDKAPVVPPVVIMEEAHVPAGSRTVSTAAELATFARTCMSGGVTLSGERILSEQSVKQMLEVQAARPPSRDVPQAQGLGWLLTDCLGVRVAGHGGGTIGQVSFLEGIPERDLVIVLLTNAEAGQLLWRDLGGWLFETLAGVRLPRVPQPADPAPELRLQDYAGVYERLGVRHEVRAEDGRLVWRTSFTGPLAELHQGPDPEVALRPVDPGAFHTAEDGYESLVTFLEFRDGRPGYLFSGRAARRTADQA